MKALPKFATAAELAELAGVTERRIQQLAESEIIPKPEKRGEYAFRESVQALFAYMREQANGLPAQTAADRARQAKADADSAELDAAKKAGVLMFTDDAKRMWATALVKFREVILRSGISKTAQKEITDKLQRVQLEE